jgi:hypothetical protein
MPVCRCSALVCWLAPLLSLQLDAAAFAQAQSIPEQRAKLAAEALVKPFAAKEKPVTLGLKAFVYGDTEATSPFLCDCRQALSDALVASGKCKVVERETARLNELLQEDKLRESGMTATSSASLLGNMLEADAMLFGKAVETDFRFRLDLELLSTADGSKLAAAKMEFIKDELPATGVKPTVHQEILAATQAIAAQPPQAPATAPGTPDNRIEVGVLPTRAHNPVYQAGEEIQFRVWANRECYLRLVCIDAGGSKYQIFPNRYQSSYRLQAWKEQVIPSPDHPFRYRIVPPFGTEMVLAFAASTPFELPGFGMKAVGSLTQIDAGAKGLIEGLREKGVGIFEEGGAYAEAHCVLNTTETVTGRRGLYVPIR